MSEEKEYSPIEKYWNSQEYKKMQNDVLAENEKELIKEKGIKELIPQFWWGDIDCEEPEMVILGRNPSFCIDDILDNKYFSDDFKKNINGNNESKNLLLGQDKIFICSGVSRWWREAFKGRNITSMEGIAIYNLFGFYSKKYPKNIDIKLSHINVLEDLKEKIVKQIKSSKIVFLMWEKSFDAWKELLGKENFKGMNIYVVNHKCACNRYLKSSYPMLVDKDYNLIENVKALDIK